MGRIKTPALFCTPAAEAKRYNSAGIAEANAHPKLILQRRAWIRADKRQKMGLACRLQVEAIRWKSGVLAKGVEALGTGLKQKPVTASAELSGDPPRWRSLSGCLLEYDAVGAGSPLFVSMTARLDRNNSPQSVRCARVLADEERHMHCFDASQRHEARALSHLSGGGECGVTRPGFISLFSISM